MAKAKAEHGKLKKARTLLDLTWRYTTGGLSSDSKAEAATEMNIAVLNAQLNDLLQKWIVKGEKALKHKLMLVKKKLDDELERGQEALDDKATLVREKLEAERNQIKSKIDGAIDTMSAAVTDKVVDAVVTATVDPKAHFAAAEKELIATKQKADAAYAEKKQLLESAVDTMKVKLNAMAQDQKSDAEAGVAAAASKMTSEFEAKASAVATTTIDASAKSKLEKARKKGETLLAKVDAHKAKMDAKIAAQLEAALHKLNLLNTKHTHDKVMADGKCEARLKAARHAVHVREKKLSKIDKTADAELTAARTKLNEALAKLDEVKTEAKKDQEASLVDYLEKLYETELEFEMVDETIPNLQVLADMEYNVKRDAAKQRPKARRCSLSWTQVRLRSQQRRGVVGTALAKLPSTKWLPNFRPKSTSAWARARATSRTTSRLRCKNSTPSCTISQTRWTSSRETRTAHTNRPLLGRKTRLLWPKAGLTRWWMMRRMHWLPMPRLVSTAWRRTLSIILTKRLRSSKKSLISSRSCLR